MSGRHTATPSQADYNTGDKTHAAMTRRQADEFFRAFISLNWFFVIGFAFCQTWNVLCVAVPSPITYEHLSPDLRWLSALTCVLTTLPVVICPDKAFSLLGRKSFTVTIGMIATLGSLLGPVSAIVPSLQNQLIYLAAVLVGVGFSSLFLIWYRIIVQQGNMATLAVSVAVCALFTYPLAMFVNNGIINRWFESVVACALPIVSIIMLWLGKRIDASRTRIQTETPVFLPPVPAQRNTLVRYCLCLFVVISIIEVIHNMLLGNAALDYYSGGVNLAALILKIVCFVPLFTVFLRKNAIGVSRACRIAFLLLLCVVLTLPFLLAGNLIAHGLLDLCAFFFQLIVILAAFQMCEGYRINPLIVFGWARIAWALGVITGIVLNALFRVQPAQVASFLTVGLGIAAACAFLFLFTDSDCVSLLAEALPSSDQSPFRMKIKQLAIRGRLSNREADILALVAKGRSANRISEDMNISLATTNTHIHHIYQKLGIHSRQELLDIIDKELP